MGYIKCTQNLHNLQNSLEPNTDIYQKLIVDNGLVGFMDFLIFIYECQFIKQKNFLICH